MIYPPAENSPSSGYELGPMLDESPDQVRSADGSRFTLALFGKHPAWSDHLEDIGLDTPSLAEFKNWFYVEGIRSNLDTGAWERLEEEHRLPEWNHRLFMTGPRGMLIARIWASSDGRGRRAFPMVAVTHLPTSRLPADLSPLFDALDEVRSLCIQAETQQEVIAAARSGLVALESAVKLLAPLPADGPPVEERRRFVSSLADGFGPEVMERVLHVMGTDLVSHSPGSKKKADEALPKEFRLPVSATDSEKQLLMWHAFFQPHIKPETLWTAVHAMGQDWADVIVGRLDPAVVFAFRATPTALPVISAIPYSIPPERREVFSTILQGFAVPPYIIPQVSENSPGGGKTGSLIGRIFGKS